MLQRYNDKITQQKRAQTTNRLTCTNDPLLTCTDDPSTCTGHHLVEESYWKGGMKMPGPPKGPQPFCSGKVQESHHSPVPSRSSEKRWKKDEPGMQRKVKRDPLHWSKCQSKNTSIEVKWCRMQDSLSSKQDNCKTEVATPQIAILYYCRQWWLAGNIHQIKSVDLGLLYPISDNPKTSQLQKVSMAWAYVSAQSLPWDFSVQSCRLAAGPGSEALFSDVKHPRATVAQPFAHSRLQPNDIFKISTQRNAAKISQASIVQNCCVVVPTWKKH